MLIRYIFKRILIFIPTLFVISLVIFLLDKYMPGDPVLRGMTNEDAVSERLYKERWKTFNLNHATFYFSFTSKAQPDTLYNIPRKTQQKLLKQLVYQTGNWETTQQYYRSILAMKTATKTIKKDTANADNIIDAKFEATTLLGTSERNEIEAAIQDIQDILDKDSTLHVLQQPFVTLKKSYQDFKDNPTTWKKYIPTIQWHGFNNQYHIWVFGNQPWISKTKNVLDVDKQNLTTTVIDHKFVAKTKGYYKVIPRFKQIENNGNLSKNSLKSKKIFGVNVNNNDKIYSLEELREKEFLVLAKVGETIPISLKATTISKTYQLKYDYDLDVVQLLNYNPAKRSKGFLRFDFGKNFQLIPVKTIIENGIYWTVLISTLSILLTYLIAIPIGVYSARNKGSRSDNIISTALFMLYSLPNFWIATLLIVFLAGQLGWFPVFGLGDVPADASMFETFQVRAYHLILPLFCWTYPTLAFLSRQMRGGMLTTLNKDFIRTARAKGLEESTVIWKHGFRNSLLPIITLFANVFPRMVSGSIVVEVIFGIPGMGQTLLNAINSNDFPTVFAIVMLTALLTMIGYLIADILYAMVDPRIKYK